MSMHTPQRSAPGFGMLALLVLLLNGNPGAGQEKGEPTPTEKPEASSVKPGDQLLIELGDIKIKASTIWRIEHAHLRQQAAQTPDFKISDNERADLRKKIALKELEMELLQAFAAKEKLDVTKEESEGRMAQLREGLKEKGTTFEAFLDSMGKSEEAFRKTSDAIVAVEKMLRKHVSEKEVKDEFAKEQDRLPLRRCSHILYAYKGAQRSMATRSREEAEKAANEGLETLREKDLDFGDFAKALSDCPSRERGGDLGFIARKGNMVEPFAEAVYKLEKAGDLSGVVESDFGFHLVKLTALCSVVDFYAQLRETLMRKKFDGFMQELRGLNIRNAKINQALLESTPSP